MFQKGLYLDADLLSQPEGTYPHSLNSTLVRTDGVLMREEGTQLIAALPAGHENLGWTTLDDGRILLFHVHPTSGVSTVSLFDGSTRITLLTDGAANTEKLNFGTPIEATIRVSANGDVVAYWVDGVNPPRRLVIDPTASTSRDVDTLRLFSQTTKAPTLTSISVENAGGILKTGTYHIAISLETGDNDRTPYLYVTPAMSVIEEATGSSGVSTADGSDKDNGTSKSIKATFENLDESYTYVRAALIRGTNVTILPRIPIQNGGATVRATGGEAGTPGDIAEIVIDPAIYSSAKAISQDQDVLYLANLTREDDVGFQSYANNITVELVRDQFQCCKTTPPIKGWITASGVGNDMRHPETQLLKGFKRGEVYALYISLLYRNGTESPAYHIPGRAPVGNETGSTFTTPTTASDLGATAKFQTEPQADANGMAFWQNQIETYPNTNDFQVKDPDMGIVGDLRGVKVRHHHIPFETNSSTLPFPGTSSTNNAQTVGLKFSNIKFPPSILKRIIGYKMYYAKRGIENSRWVGQMFGAPIRYGNDNGSGLDQHKLGNDGILGEDVNVDTYLAGQPFSLLRTKFNLGTVSGGYIRNIYTSSTDNYPSQDGPRVAIPTNNTVTPGHVYTKIKWAGYVEEDSTQNIGINNDIIYNKLVPEIVVLELERPYNFENEVFDIFRFRTDVYEPFHEQNLVFTGYVGQPDEQTTGKVFGGDIFIGYYAYVSGSPQANDGPSTIPMIHQVVVESIDNVVLRQEGDEEGDTYFPKLSGIVQDTNYLTADVDGDLVDTAVPYMRNYIEYNEEYSDLNRIKPAFGLNPFEVNISTYPTRIIRSTQKDVDSQRDHFRTFLEEDYTDLTTQRGEILKLSAYGGGLLIHARKSLFNTKGKSEIQVGDNRAYLGSGDILAIKPEEIFPTEGGYAGISHPHHAISTPGGYVFVDVEAGRVFRLANGLKDIGSLGVKDRFADIPSNSLFELGYDAAADGNRVFISKKGEDPFTLSFLLDRDVWESFHSGSPTAYFWTSRRLYGIEDAEIYGRGMGDEGGYYGETGDWEMDFVDRKDVTSNNLVSHVAIKTLFQNPDTTEVYDEHVTEIRVTNHLQDSGWVTLVPGVFGNGNCRRTERVWRVGGMKDQKVYPLEQLVSFGTKRNMIGEAHRVSMKYGGNKIGSLFAAWVDHRPQLR